MQRNDGPRNKLIGHDHEPLLVVLLHVRSSECCLSIKTHISMQVTIGQCHTVDRQVQNESTTRSTGMHLVCYTDHEYSVYLHV